MSFMAGNLFWGMQFCRFWNFWDFADTKSSLNPKNSKKLQKPHRHYFDCFKCESKCARIVIARQIYDLLKQFAEFVSVAKQPSTIKSNPCDSTKNSPTSWCKKSDSKGAVVPPVDFLLEAEKRGSPPKSEKAVAFWEHNLNKVGGSGCGAQPFLRKESSESKIKFSDSVV